MKGDVLWSQSTVTRSNNEKTMQEWQMMLHGSSWETLGCVKIQKNKGCMVPRTLHE